MPSATKGKGTGQRRAVIKRNKQRKARKKHEEALAARPDSERAGPLALRYLAEWARREKGGWKFNKTRQSYLLKHWPDRVRVPAVDFKLLLAYLQSLSGASRQRTMDDTVWEADRGHHSAGIIDVLHANQNARAP